MSIKVGKSKKILDILSISLNNPINNGLNLAMIYANAISTDDVTQEFHFKLIEITLLQFGIKPNLLKLLQNQTYMAFMVLHVF
jgi:hypothetical protein